MRQQLSDAETSGSRAPETATASDSQASCRGKNRKLFGWNSSEAKAVYKAASTEWEALFAEWDSTTDEERGKRVIENQKVQLLDHTRPKIETFGKKRRFWDKQHNVLFHLELAPYSGNRAGCRLWKCEDKTDSGDYRIAVNAGDPERYWSESPGKSDYHCS